VVFVIGQPATPYYGIFNCFASSSPREGLSIALLEAMSCGLPCVVTCNDVHPVLVHGQNGIIVGVYDAAFLSEALNLLIQDPVAACRMGEVAQKTVLERYTVDRMARAYQKVFTSCIGEKEQ
jgi:glycosyltransferase involved in cell wall biosynthesis